MKKIARLLALILALLMLLMPVASASVDVKYAGETYSFKYEDAILKNGDAIVGVSSSGLPIIGGVPQVPATGAADFDGERVKPYKTDVHVDGSSVLYVFYFHSDTLPEAVWIYPDGNEDSAELLWGTPQSNLDVMTFGHYEQDGDTSNGAEPIEWLVLESDGETATLISKYVLDAQPFNAEYADTTWETCSLRKWLNGDFLNAAFTDEEQARLMATEVKAEVNSGHKEVDRGSDTRDRLFLLSVSKAKKYWREDYERVAYPTEYALTRGVDAGNDGSSYWWLRTPGTYPDRACYVCGGGYSGMIVEFGEPVDTETIGVRPVIVLWLSEQTTPPPAPSATPTVEPTPEPTPQPVLDPNPSITAGDIVRFGHYEQDNDLSNGAEEIEWLVLETDGETALLISRNGLEAKAIGADRWEDSEIREWLNDDFLNAAFTNEEQMRLEVASVTADANPADPKLNQGADTEDMVFLLSIQEAERYFDSDKARVCNATKRAEANILEHNHITPACRWWLRTAHSGWQRDYHVVVDEYGDIDYRGIASDRIFAIRPVIVLWISDEPAPTPEPTPSPEPTPTPTPEPTPEPTPTPEPYPTLQKGSKGEEVKKLQQALIDGGFLNGKADGDFGNMTDAAVRAAQEALGLVATGVADDAFQRRLYGE